MARVEGGGADNLNFSSHTYEELRTAVFAVDEEAIRVGANEWADLKRRLNERIGTLRVMIHKLEPDWSSGAGRQALSRLRGHLSRMQALAKTAHWNEDRFDTLYETYTKAVKEMRELDATRGGQAEVASNPGNNEPLPPNLADRRQPKAAKIAHDLYSEIAITSATLDLLENAGTGIDTGSGTGSPDGASGSPDSGPGAGSRSGSSTPGTTTGSPGTLAPPPSKAATPGGGPVLAGSSQARSLTQPGGGANPGQTPAGGNPNSGFGVAPAARDEFGAAARSSTGAGGPSGVGRGVIGPPRGTGGVGAPPDGPGSRTLGGPPPRPGVATPGAGLPGGGQPAHPGMPGGTGGPGGGRDGPGRRTNYERGEPDLFVDKRHRAKPVIGQQPTQPKPVNTGPGVIGQQKRKPADTERQEQRPQTTPSPQGFPDKLEDGSFRSRDGAQFTVRRRGSGA